MAKTENFQKKTETGFSAEKDKNLPKLEVNFSKAQIKERCGSLFLIGKQKLQKEDSVCVAPFWRKI